VKYLRKQRELGKGKAVGKGPLDCDD
jgi:hypothetical protein